ncbi:Glucan endo-1,3-beta-glucosidase 1 [Acorus calamus]|uniref:Glucan endo-1,3-beta-glucosidase 1 n=1 Tax=Acorus calamus TaxID=4465 RepID=A0AAV9DB54_ACOCL|nr:Glucan endo-1,3-beta-glucosidase 1 [Acorus calamus]
MDVRALHCFILSLFLLFSSGDSQTTVPIINPNNPTTMTPPTPTNPTFNPTPNPTPPTTTMNPPYYSTPTTMTPPTPTAAGGGGVGGGGGGGSGGQSWCVASQSASETALQVALDYACGYGGADCSAIQTGGSCFNPDTVRDHASYAFNTYYHKNPVPTSCNFGGTAQITNTDPSTSSCQYPASTSSSGSSPPPPAGITTTPPGPTTPTGFSSPTGPTILGSEPPGSTTDVSPATRRTMRLLFTSTGILMSLITSFLG